MKILHASLSAANTLLKPAGFELRRIVPRPIDMPAALARIRLHDFGIKTVIDIGAAQGNWTKLAITSVPNANVLMVEPLREREGALQAVTQQHPRVKYALCVAGPADGETATLNVSSDLDGSTVSGSGGELRSVQVRTVDSLIDEYSLPGPYLLKFDTHGYELPILKGAVKALSHTEVIIMECYNFRFVSQAKLFYEMCVHMEALGFRPYDMAAPMLRKHDKALWQMDLFFARQEHAMFEVNSYA